MTEASSMKRDLVEKNKNSGYHLAIGKKVKL
jgi:hypothetical protein